MTKTCPHCGAPLPEGASFCHNCARTVNARSEVKIPRHMSGKAFRHTLIAAAALILILALALWLHTRPKTYDNGTAEFLYSAKGDSYRLCFAAGSAPDIPVPERHSTDEVNFAYRYPSQIYALHGDSSTLATEEFLALVESISAEVVCSDSYLSVACTEAARRPDYRPDAIALTFIDYKVFAPGRHEAEVVFTIHMKSGDVIRLHQTQQYNGLPAYKYTPQDAPMSTIEELQALVDEITATTEEDSFIYLYLPPVTYEGGLVLADRSISLYGSVDAAGRRTTFTGPAEISFPHAVHEINGIDFIGPGEGTGITALCRVHLTNCRVSGWETGFLAEGTSWINAVECTFEDNTVGMHFNISNANVSHDFYTDNVFRQNGTAILLEHTATDSILKFPNTRFSGNDTDIDNRCGQALDISEAVFE